MPVTRTEEITDAHICILGNIETEKKLEELGIGESILITVDLK